MRITDKNFFKVPVLELSVNLLGKMLIHNTKEGHIIRQRIVEVEAYASDSASHAHKGKTKRNAPMFEDGGIVYVYLCYGIFNIINIVAGHKGEPCAVMIRSTEDAVGPGRTSRTLKITKELNWEDVTTSEHVWLEDDSFKVHDVETLKRVGISYATQEDQDKLWRFRIKAN